MQQLRVWRPQHPVTQRSRTQAKINIIKGNCKVLFIQASQLIENLSARKQAGAGHGREILNALGPENVPWAVAGLGLVGVSRGTTYAQNYACMLDRSIFVI